MKIAVGCDPNAESYKQEIKKFVESLGHEVVDYGSDDTVYAHVAQKVAADVAAGICDRGIVMCGTGIGVSIAANKVQGAYCALVNNVYQAQRAQLSNNANMIALGAFVTGISLGKELVRTYLSLTFDPSSPSMPKVQAIVDYDNQRG